MKKSLPIHLFIQKNRHLGSLCRQREDQMRGLFLKWDWGGVIKGDDKTWVQKQLWSWWLTTKWHLLGCSVESLKEARMAAERQMMGSSGGVVRSGKIWMHETKSWPVLLIDQLLDLNHTVLTKYTSIFSQVVSANLTRAHVWWKCTTARCLCGSQWTWF